VVAVGNPKTHERHSSNERIGHDRFHRDEYHCEHHASLFEGLGRNRNTLNKSPEIHGPQGSVVKYEQQLHQQISNKIDRFHSGSLSIMRPSGIIFQGYTTHFIGKISRASNAGRGSHTAMIRTTGITTLNYMTSLFDEIVKARNEQTAGSSSKMAKLISRNFPTATSLATRLTITCLISRT